MTGHTPNYAFPFPQLSDIPDGATEVQSLASAVDSALLSTDSNVTADTVAIAAIDPRSTYSEYTGTTTPTAMNAWTALPFATLTDGTGLGLSVAASTTWTLTKAGVWTVNFFGLADASGAHPGVTGGIVGLATSTAFTSLYDENQSGPIANQVGGSVSAEIHSNGTATVVAGMFTAGAVSVMTSAGIVPRIRFKWSPA